MANKPKKRPPRRATRLRGAMPAAQQTRQPPPGMAELGLADAPPESDPEARAEYFKSMLEALGKHNSAEAAKIRSVLIGVISDYAQEREDNLEEAKRNLVFRLAAVEVSLMEMLLRITTKMRDRIVEQVRKVGTKSPAAAGATSVAQGMDKVVAAMEMMLEAVRQGDGEMKKRADAMMKEANALLRPQVPA